MDPSQRQEEKCEGGGGGGLVGDATPEKVRKAKRADEDEDDE